MEKWIQTSMVRGRSTKIILMIKRIRTSRLPINNPLSLFPYPGRDWYCIAEKPAPAPHLAHPEGCAALRILLLTVPRVSRYCELFPDEFNLHLLPLP